MLKKPSLLIPSYTNFHSRYSTNSHSTGKPPHHPRTHESRPYGRRKAGGREYATVRPDHGSHHPADDLQWPELRPPTLVPTPYQIFRLKRGAPYLKQRFYELVKMYHPDRAGHDHCPSHIHALPNAIKMERYRLVVAANDILSDPAKRKDYDRNGAGWDGRPEYGPPKYKWGEHNESKWSGFDTNDSPFRNATWEDWERWYQRHDREKQKPVYFSNGGFLSIIVVAAFFGVFEQSWRVDDYSSIFQRQVEITHKDASKAMMKRKLESQDLKNGEQRLHHFLRARDPRGYGITDPKEESYRKLLPEPEICMSEVVHQRATNDRPEPK